MAFMSGVGVSGALPPQAVSNDSRAKEVTRRTLFMESPLFKEGRFPPPVAEGGNLYTHRAWCTLVVYNFYIYAENAAEVNASIILHDETVLVFARCEGGGQLDADINHFAGGDVFGHRPRGVGGV